MVDGRGGARAGRPGELYPNRSDLAGTRVPPSAQYGQGVEQQAVLDAGAAAVAARPSVQPPLLDAPTARPSEPITQGLPIGAGAGPEVLGMGQPDLSRLADYLPQLEILATRPESTEEMRNFVRLIRSNASVGFP